MRTSFLTKLLLAVVCALLAVNVLPAQDQPIACKGDPAAPDAYARFQKQVADNIQWASFAGLQFEDWLADACQPELSAAVQSVLSALNAGKIAAAATQLRSSWPAIRDNPTIIPDIGPQATFDIAAISKVAAADSQLAAAAPDANLALATRLYDKWAAVRLEQLRRAATALARTGKAPYAEIRKMIRIERTRLLGGSKAESLLPEIGAIMMLAYQKGARKVPCEPTPQQVAFVTQLERDIALIGDFKDVNFTEEYQKRMNRYLRAQGRQATPARRDSLAQFAEHPSLGMLGTAAELRRGQIGPTEPTLKVAVAQKELRSGDKTDVTISLLSCGEESKPIADTTVLITLMDTANSRLADKTHGVLSDTLVKTDGSGSAHVTFIAGDSAGKIVLKASAWRHDIYVDDKGRVTASAPLIISDKPPVGTLVYDVLHTYQGKFGCNASKDDFHSHAELRLKPGKRDSAVATVTMYNETQLSYDNSERGCDTPPPCGMGGSTQTASASAAAEIHLLILPDSTYQLAFNVDQFPSQFVAVSKRMGQKGCEAVPAESSRLTGIPLPAVVFGKLDPHSRTISGTFVTTADGTTRKYTWNFNR